MKKLPTILLLLFLCGFSAAFWHYGLMKDTFPLWSILWLVIFLPNMVCAFLLPRLGVTPKQLLFLNMVIKLCNIPLFVGGIVGALLLTQSSDMMIVVMLLFFFVPFDYSLLLPFSMYGISGIWQHYRNGTFSAVETAVNIILHVFFCIDVLSPIYCYIRARKVLQSNASPIEGTLNVRKEETSLSQ